MKTTCKMYHEKKYNELLNWNIYVIIFKKKNESVSILWCQTASFRRYNVTSSTEQPFRGKTCTSQRKVLFH